MPGPVNLVRLTQLIDLVDAPELRFAPYQPGWPVQLTPGQSFFERLQQGDGMIHQPYESFDAVLAFLRARRSRIPTCWRSSRPHRTGSKGEITSLLREAVRRGKEVTAVVEPQGALRRGGHINNAELLESIGAQVVYGVVGLKTHAKMLLVTRREPRPHPALCPGLDRQLQPGTARLYTDISYLSADEALTADIEQVFLHLASQNRLCAPGTGC